MGLSAAARKALLGALASDDPQERAQGAFELAEGQVRSARSAIEALLGDPVPLVRGAAALGSWRLGGGADAAAEALIPLLRSRDEEARQLAVHALGRMGNAAVPALQKAARGRARHQAAARRVLAEIQGED
ncbi:HEAT repeat protein [Planctomycetes bacterium Poly30]|uniref:HEAT repeat protein n=1 Tax=Saltatorellus ferox TaxID=2528018 RepID=A0A518F0G2_9BACT|nr:HEAT repeat protein [Planctomycetes bacterium Poly30]